jgi:Metallo-peptidase family M12B Reprolysin-like
MGKSGRSKKQMRRSCGLLMHWPVEPLERRLLLDNVAVSPSAVLNSYPSARAQLYLDFSGDTTPQWGQYQPGTTPAYDSDGDPTTFSPADLSNIHEIWARVSEKFSPFNINVATVQPADFSHGSTIEIVIGGNGVWSNASTGKESGGVSFVGSFTNPDLPNKSFVFPANLAGGDLKDIAEATAHESGHAFGLKHQAQWINGVKQTNYNPGDGTTGPIMGVSYGDTYGRWSYGQKPNGQIQDDLAVLSSVIGYRSDDHADSGRLRFLKLFYRWWRDEHFLEPRWRRNVTGDVTPHG